MINYNEFTCNQLKDILKQNGISGYTHLNKEGLIQYVKQNKKLKGGAPTNENLAITTRQTLESTPNSQINFIVFHPLLPIFASWARNTVKIWEIDNKDWKVLLIKTFEIVNISSVSFHPNLPILAYSHGYTTRITPYGREEGLNILPGVFHTIIHTNMIHSVFFHSNPDIPYLVSYSDREIILWKYSMIINNTTLQILRINTFDYYSINSRPFASFRSVSFHPIFPFLIANVHNLGNSSHRISNTIKLWNIDLDQSTMNFITDIPVENLDYITSIHFHPTLKLFAYFCSINIEFWEFNDNGNYKLKGIKQSFSSNSISFNPMFPFLVFESNNTIKVLKFSNDINDINNKNIKDPNSCVDIKKYDLAEVIKSVIFHPNPNIKLLVYVSDKNIIINSWKLKSHLPEVHNLLHSKNTSNKPSFSKLPKNLQTKIINNAFPHSATENRKKSNNINKRRNIIKQMLRSGKNKNDIRNELIKHKLYNNPNSVNIVINKYFNKANKTARNYMEYMSKTRN